MTRLFNMTSEEAMVWGLISAFVLLVIVVIWRGRSGEPRRERDDF